MCVASPLTSLFLPFLDGSCALARLLIIYGRLSLEDGRLGILLLLYANDVMGLAIIIWMTLLIDERVLL